MLSALLRAMVRNFPSEKSEAEAPILPHPAAKSNTKAVRRNAGWRNKVRNAPPRANNDHSSDTNSSP